MVIILYFEYQHGATPLDKSNLLTFATHVPHSIYTIQVDTTTS